MQIGKIVVSTTWTKVEDLIKAQISGQSAFAFSEGETYELQGETNQVTANLPIRLCNSGTMPVMPNDGKRIKGTQTGKYAKESGADLYARADKSGAYLNIDKVEE